MPFGDPDALATRSAATSSSRRCRGGACRGTADRLDARLAGRRRGDRGVLQEATARAPQATARRRRRPASDDLAHRPSAHTRRRRRHRAARARDHSQPQQRLLRRRRRPAGGRLAGACRAAARSRLDARISTARSRSCRRPPTTAGCATSWATTAAGSTSRTSATTSDARSGRWGTSSRRPGSPPSCDRQAISSTGSSARSAPMCLLRTAAYTVLGLSRLDADRLEPAARRRLERLVEQLADAYERTSAEDWCWFEDELTYDNARLSQALLAGGSALGRAGAHRDRSRVAALVWRRVRTRPE